MSEAIRRKTAVRMHIDNCIESYAVSDATDFSQPPDRAMYEQLRADLLIAIGMLCALAEDTEGKGNG